VITEAFLKGAQQQNRYQSYIEIENLVPYYREKLVFYDISIRTPKNSVKALTDS